MKTTVIFHNADYDGIFCREIARKFLPEAALIGWNYGDPQLPIPPEGTIYILDLSPDCLQDGHFGDRVIWIDHHKTAIDQFGSSLPGYRIDGVAACRLAWQWFSEFQMHDPTSEGHATLPGSQLPTKAQFLAREVSEPLSVRLAGEYDIWDHRGDGDLEFQFGLRTYKDSLDWNLLFGDSKSELLPSGTVRFTEGGDVYVKWLVDAGTVAMKYSANVDAGMTKALSFLIEWEGLRFLALNTGRFNSQTFAARDVPETGHEALLGFNWNGNRWTVSLYHAAHRKDLDLSEIAKRHGGGGHRGACGFSAASLPFAL